MTVHFYFHLKSKKMVSGRGLAKENVWTGINCHHQISAKLLDLSRFVECGSVHWLLERAAKWQPHMPKVKLKRRHSIHTAAPEGKEELQHLQLPAKWNQHRIPLAPCAKVWKYLPGMRSSPKILHLLQQTGARQFLRHRGLHSKMYKLNIQSFPILWQSHRWAFAARIKRNQPWRRWWLAGMAALQFDVIRIAENSAFVKGFYHLAPP